MIWSKSGERRLPSTAELDRAITALTPDDFAFLCELGPLGPLYFLPTRSFITALARQIRALGVVRVLEVGAGEGLLARSLQKAAPELQVFASDSGAWVRPEGRMNEADRRAHRGIEVPGLSLGVDVRRLTAAAAIKKLVPDLVLAAWLPPEGKLLDSLIRSPVSYVLDIGAPEATPGPYSWRFAHEFLSGPLEAAARCRLDARPQKQRHSRITLYFGGAHPEHHEERVRSGDWLAQFRPLRSSPKQGRKAK